MASLIFLLSILSLLVLIIILILKAIRGRPLIATFKKIGWLIAGYTIVWIVFRILWIQVPVPFGTDICFDDWCATITGYESGATIQKQFSALGTESDWLVLHVRMSNHARGISQKPSEPRVFIRDDQGRSWPYSNTGQQLFEKISGIQPAIYSRLELHQSLETIMIFQVPKNAKGLYVVIEEGPFITRFIFPENQSLFRIK